MTATVGKSKSAQWGTVARRYHPLLLAAVWLAVQVLCWHLYHGPHVYGDGLDYLAYARQLLATGHFAGGHYGHYAGYAAFMALLLRAGWGLWGIGLAQVALSGLAAIAFYRTAWQLAGQCWPPAAGATLAWLTWLSVQAFNPVLLTESVFTSCLVLSLWGVVRLRRARGAWALLVLLLYTATVRPNGFIALAAAALAGLVLLWQRGRRGWAALGLLGLVGLGLLVLNAIIEPFWLLPNYAAGVVVFDYRPSAIAPPATLWLPGPQGWPLARLGWFVAHNFGYFCQLCAAKAAYFLGWPRPWYSLAHRLWAFTVLPAMYGLAVLGAGRRQVPAPVRVYLAAAILLQLSIVALTTEDRDERFSAPLVAYWLQLAALGVRPLLGRGAAGAPG